LRTQQRLGVTQLILRDATAQFADVVNVLAPHPLDQPIFQSTQKLRPMA
jgi:hypothetical protein